MGLTDSSSFQDAAAIVLLQRTHFCYFSFSLLQYNRLTKTELVHEAEEPDAIIFFFLKRQIYIYLPEQHLNQQSLFLSGKCPFNAKYHVEVIYKVTNTWTGIEISQVSGL